MFKINNSFIESLFNSIMEGRAETVWAVDRNLFFSYVNNLHMAESFHSRLQDDHENDVIPGEYALAGVKGEEKEFWFNKYHAALNGQRDIFEYTFTKDLKKKIYEIEINPILIDGKIEGAVCFSRDISEDRKIRENLKNSDNLLHIFVSNLMGVAFIMDENGIFRLSQGKGLKKLSLKPDQVVGLSVYEVYKDYPLLLDCISRCLGGEDHFSQVVQVGALFFDSSFQALYNEEGEISGLLGISMDITERMKIEMELEKSRDTLRHMEKIQAIGQLAGGVAHDFNNQLMGIYGYAELIDREVNEKSIIKEYTRNIIEATDHSAALAAQLLTFARKGIVNHRTMDMHSLIEKTLIRLRSNLDKKIRINMNLKAEKSLLMGDESELQNCLFNMAINSRDAMKEGGTLTFSTENQTLDRSLIMMGVLDVEPGEYLVLKIGDTGCGMDRETRERIFEPFFTTKDPHKGTGMGLPMVYGAIKKHKGDIKVMSTPQRGTEFQIYLPSVSTGGSAKS